MQTFFNYHESIENSGRKLVIVDIQPSSKNYIFFNMKEFLKFAMTYDQVVVLYNGPELGFENANEIARWYHENGVPGTVLRKWRWYEKNYAWFRDLMDVGCHERSHLVRLIRYMIKNKFRDWRELKQQDFNRLKLPNLTVKLINDYSFYIPDLAFKIKSLNGSDVCGGHVEACLSEVLLLAEATNTKLNVIHKYCY